MAWNFGLVSTVAVAGLVVSAPTGLIVEPLSSGPEPVVVQALNDDVDRSGDDDGGSDGNGVDGQQSRVHQQTVSLASSFSHPTTTEAALGAVVEVDGNHDSLLIHGKSGDLFAVRVGTADQWSDWIEIANEETEAPDETTSDDLALGPVWLGDEAMRFELVDLNSANDSPSGVEGRDLVITLLTDPEFGVAPRVAGKTQTAPGARPDIHPRSDWTDKGRASGVNGCDGTPGYADNISALVVHHTVTNNDYPADKVDDLLRAILYAHVEINGWCDIGYNFVVDRFGRIWEARAGGIDRPVIGGHAKGYNTSTVGVAMLGQHHPGAKPTAVKPSGATEEAIVGLATWKLGLHGVDINGMTWLRNRSSSGPQKRAANEWHYVPTILGHRDLGVTSCPGDHGIDLVHRLPNALAKTLDSAPPYGAEQWNSADSGPGFVTIDQRGGLRAAGSAQLSGMGAAGSPELVAAEAGKPLAIAVAVPSGQADPAASSTLIGGYVLTETGRIRSFGGQSIVAEQPSVTEPLVDIAASADGQGGWVVSRNGKVVGFDGQANRPVVGATTVAMAAALDGEGSGYVLTSDKALLSVGTSPAATLDREAGANAAEGVVDIALGADSSSGWVLMTDGRVVPFGDAPEVSLDRRAPAGTDYRAIVAAGTGTAGWLMATDGSLWPFGGAHLIKPLTTGAGNGDVVDVGMSAMALPTVARTDPDGIYFDAVSQLFRGTPATDDELAQWSWSLTHGGGRKAVVAPLRSSTVKAETIARLAAEDSGDPGAFVDHLYLELLGRPSDPGGRSYWAGLATSKNPKLVVRQLISSKESRIYRTNKIYVDVLGRLPNDGEKGIWSNKLRTVDDGLLVGELASSAEFYNRVN